MEVTSFADIEAAFLARVHTMVWCNMATLDRRNRLRSRVMHPIWEGTVGRIATYPQTLKTKHLAHHPYVSLAYIADPVKPVYVDCRAEWDDRPETKQHVWELFLNAPPPLGYDPAPIFHSIDHPKFGILQLTPWRIELADATGERLVWHSPES
jgi:hypothetical protein